MNEKGVRTTVVGGRAPEDDTVYTIPISGVEQVLKFAAGDMTFRENLFEQRSKAVMEFGIVLSPSEAAMIDGVPENQLRSLVRAVVTRYRHAPAATRWGS